MAKNNRYDVYKCEECGNIIEVMHEGPGEMTCCSNPMKYIKAGVVEASKEKHIPVIEKVEGGYKVLVGSVAHPMEEKHYIEWIELIVNGNYVMRQYLKPNDKPEAFFKVDNAKSVMAREYCNLHGLWAKE